MSTTYAQCQTAAQKKDASNAASVLDASSQSESLQRKAEMTNAAAQREEAPRPNNTGMPDNLKAGIESLSGFSMDDVRVHYNSSKPATVQALAYTQGTDIHVAPGQEKCLPHEAWHVAQQMAGRVSPTTNINGMPVNDNAALEHEADVMGERAVQCKEAEKRITQKFSHKTINQRISQQKTTDELKDEDIQFFEEYLAKKEAYYLWDRQEGHSKDYNDQKYFEGLNKVRKRLDEKAKTAAYYDWENNAASTNDDDNSRYYKARKKMLLEECLNIDNLTAENHPEREKFINTLVSTNLINSEEAAKIWNIIFEGLKTQKECNKQAEFNVGDANKKIRDKNEENKDVNGYKPIEEYPQDVAFTADMSRIRHNNDTFKRLKDPLKPLLKVNNKKLALWSGGYDLSTFASNCGCTTLETTAFGKALDSIFLSNSWSLIGPLWNIVSEFFVEAFTEETGDKEVHVFIRNYDPVSVLVRQEIETLESCNVPIYWHCIISPRDDANMNNYNTLDKNGEPKETKDVDKSDLPRREDECVMLLMNYYEGNQHKNLENSTYKRMQDQFSKSVNSTFFEVRENIALLRYHSKIKELAYYRWKDQHIGDKTGNYYYAQEIVNKFIERYSKEHTEKVKLCAYYLYEKNSKKVDSNDLSTKDMDWHNASLIEACNSEEFLKLKLQ